MPINTNDDEAVWPDPPVRLAIGGTRQLFG
jgi:hypothetical protein